MPRQITPATSLENLKNEAKRWLKSLRAHDPAAVARFKAVYPSGPDNPVLRDVQHALAREHGLDSWTALRAALDRVVRHERIAGDLVQAYGESDDTALARVNAHFGQELTHEDLRAVVWGRVYAVRQRASKAAQRLLAPDEARLLLAQVAGFPSWAAFTQSLATGGPAPVPAFGIDEHERAIFPRRRMTGGEWDELLAAAREHRISTLRAGGFITDTLLGRITALEHVTALSLTGARRVTDEGLAQLARMPQLRHLELTDTTITDRGLEVLRHLPNLRSFEMTWQQRITDAGVAHLRFCDRLERVELMGTPTGDGVLAALRGKAHLHNLATGRLVTDAGLPLLKDLPMLAAASPVAVRVLIDGPFTDAGLAALAGLEGLRELDLFWHVKNTTPDGFRHLRQLPHLETLGCDGDLSGDEAMRHIAALPRLRKLRAQSSVATDSGWEALSRSATLEELWGRECPHFGSRGFLALSRMPSLRALGIGCRNVSDDALSTLPAFPALRGLTPIGVTDHGFRHVGRCARLERVSCMYCRDTTDLATEHIANLSLNYYYAGLTQITDRSLEILGGMSSLERIDLYECKGVTNAGVAHLARLPRLREVSLDHLPGVTIDGTRLFPTGVRVHYST